MPLCGASPPDHTTSPPTISPCQPPNAGTSVTLKPSGTSILTSVVGASFSWSTSRLSSSVAPAGTPSDVISAWAHAGPLAASVIRATEASTRKIAFRTPTHLRCRTDHEAPGVAGASGAGHGRGYNLRRDA